MEVKDTRSWQAGTKESRLEEKKKRCLSKGRLDIGISYTRGKAGLDENNKKKEGNDCLGEYEN